MNFLRSRSFLAMVVVCLVSVGAVKNHFANRERALQILAAEEAAGLECFRPKVPSLLAQLPDFITLHRWFNLPLYEELIDVTIRDEIQDPEGLGWALRKLGPIRSLHLIVVKPQHASRFLRALRKQPKLGRLTLDGIGLDEEINQILLNFRGLVNLKVSARNTFENFPRLSKLKYLEVRSPSLTEAGFRAILRSPALENAFVDEIAHLDLKALRSIEFWKGPALRELKLSMPGLTEEQATRLETDLRKTTGLQMWIRNW